MDLKLLREINRIRKLMGITEGLNLPKKQLSPPQSWFKSILNQTTGPHTTPDYPDSLFYKLDNDVIFEYKKKLGIFGFLIAKFGQFLKIDLIWNMMIYKPLSNPWWKNITNWDQ